MKKKLLSFVLLIVFALLLTYLAGNVDYTAAGALVESEFDELGIGMAIFMEAFVTIHMSVFVLFPLAGIINKNKNQVLIPLKHLQYLFEHNNHIFLHH